LSHARLRPTPSRQGAIVRTLPVLLERAFRLDWVQLTPDKFEKKRDRTSNWPLYNEGLRQRGDVKDWLKPKVETAYAQSAARHGVASRPIPIWRSQSA
jgi:hypothetical protein